MTPIYVVCTGPNYNPSHVMRFERQLKEHVNIDFKVHCYTTYDASQFDKSIEVIPIKHDDGRRQWHKIDFFKFAPKGETVFVSDLDWTFIGDVTDIFSQEVKQNELIAPYRWWTRHKGQGFTINGGLYKFIGGDHYCIPNTFYGNSKYWMQHYIVDRQLAHPPVNGEQNFVDETLRNNKSILKYFEPQDAFGRLPSNHEHAVEYNELYLKHYGHEHYYIGEFNERVRMIQSVL
jgi:hypothetical protein